METQSQKGTEKVTEQEVRARLTEAEVVREFVLRSLDDRIETLRSALKDESTETLDDSQRILEGLPWAKGHRDKSFEWCFNTSKDGDQLPETAEAARLIESAKDHKLIVAGYRYELSVDRKFLSRRRVR